MSQENQDLKPAEAEKEQKVVPMVKPAAEIAPAAAVEAPAKSADAPADKAPLKAEAAAVEKPAAKKKPAPKKKPVKAKKAAPKKAPAKKKAVGKKPASVKKKAVTKPKAPTASKPQTVKFAGSTSNKPMEKMMTKTKTQFDGYMKDANEASRESYDAFVKSSTLFAKGFEDIFQTSLSLAQSAAEKQAQFMKEAMSSKTLNEFTEVQNKIAQANFDDFMAGATKISELSVKLLSDASEPMNEQMQKSMNKVAKAA